MCSGPICGMYSGHMVWDVFGIHVVGRVRGRCCGTLDIVTNDLLLCPRLGNIVVKGQKEGIADAGWQMAWLVQH